MNPLQKLEWLLIIGLCAIGLSLWTYLLRKQGWRWCLRKNAVSVGFIGIFIILLLGPLYWFFPSSVAKLIKLRLIAPLVAIYVVASGAQFVYRALFEKEELDAPKKNKFTHPQ